MAVKETKNGVMIPADHAIEWEDGKTGAKYSILLSTVKNPAVVVEWALRRACNESTRDAHSGVKVPEKAGAARDKALADATTKANARLAVILAGGVTTRAGGGGRKADAVAIEAINALILRFGMSASAFVKAFGSGREAVSKCFDAKLREANSAKLGANAEAVFASAAFSAKVEALMAETMTKAAAEVERRRADAAAAAEDGLIL